MVSQAVHLTATRVIERDTRGRTKSQMTEVQVVNVIMDGHCTIIFLECFNVYYLNKESYIRPIMIKFMQYPDKLRLYSGFNKTTPIAIVPNSSML